MSFSADWLSLRRDADLRARDPALAPRLASDLAAQQRPIRVLDLGAGTGANLAALAPALPGRQSWVLVDNDPQLLARVTAPEGVTVETRIADIATDLDAAVSSCT